MKKAKIGVEQFFKKYKNYIYTFMGALLLLRLMYPDTVVPITTSSIFGSVGVTISIGIILVLITGVLLWFNPVAGTGFLFLISLGLLGLGAIQNFIIGLFGGGYTLIIGLGIIAFIIYLFKK